MTPDQEQGLIYQVEALFSDKVHPNAGTNVAQFPNVMRASRLGMEARTASLFVDRRSSDALTRSLLYGLLGITPTPLKIVVFGDSISAGHNSADGTGYTGYLADLLDRRPAPIAATIDRGGCIDGAQLGGVAATVPAVLGANPDAKIALFMVGTNDASPTGTNAPPASWVTSYGNVIDQILATLPNIKVVCGRIVLAGPQAAGYTAIKAANEAAVNGYVDSVVSARTETGRVAKMDMSVVLSSALTDPVNPDWHPGDAGYLQMAHIAFDAIAPWLP